jgi:hypothetical protein
VKYGADAGPPYACSFGAVTTMAPVLLDLSVATVASEPLTRRAWWLQRARATPGFQHPGLADKTKSPYVADSWALALTLFAMLAQDTGHMRRLMLTTRWGDEQDLMLDIAKALMSGGKDDTELVLDMIFQTIADGDGAGARRVLRSLLRLDPPEERGNDGLLGVLQDPYFAPLRAPAAIPRGAPPMEEIDLSTPAVRRIEPLADDTPTRKRPLPAALLAMARLAPYRHTDAAARALYDGLRFT